MFRIRRPRRFNRTAPLLVAGLLLTATTGLVIAWLGTRKPAAPAAAESSSGMSDLLGAVAGGTLVVLAALVALVGLAGALVAVLTATKDAGPGPAATAQQRLGHLTAQLPAERRLLDLESGRRLWIRHYTTGSGAGLESHTALGCLDIDDDFAMTVTVYTLTETGATRTRTAAATLPEDHTVLALASAPGHGTIAEESELEELAAQLDRVVLDTERRRRHRPVLDPAP